MDRDELDERLRQRGGGEGPFRRGMNPDDEAHGGGGPPGYQRFRPEPEDELVRWVPGTGGSVPHVDHTGPGFDERPAPPPPPPPVPVYEPPPPPPPEESAPPPPEADGPEVDTRPGTEPDAPQLQEPAWVPPPPPPQPAWQPPPPAYEPPASDHAEEPVPSHGPWEEDEDGYEPAAFRSYGDDDRGSGGGIGPLMVGLFVVLGILAVGIGAALSGVFGDGVAQATPTPSALVTQQATPSPTLEPSIEPSIEPTVEPTPGGGSPFIFPDGFTAETQPCAEQPESFSGCDSSGATVSDGAVWVWIGFRKGNDADRVSVTIVNAAGATAGDSSLLLGDVIDCGDSCNGWLRFRFGSLEPGNYGIRVARNGLPAAEASFTVLN